MAEKMSKTKKESVPDNSTSLNLESFTDMQKNAFEALGEINKMIFENTVSFNEEMTHFVNKRLKEDIDTTNKFANCKTAHEAYEVYSKFLKTAFRQYMKEAEKLSKIGNHMVGQSLKIMEQSAEKSPKKAR